MFDIGMSELLLIGIVALIVVGPKDLPHLFHTLGRFTAKARSLGREFNRAMNEAARESGIDDVAKGLNAAANPKKFGLDKLNQAADKFENWEPTKPAPAPKVENDPEREADIAAIREATEKAGQAKLDREAAAKAAEVPAETAEAAAPARKPRAKTSAAATTAKPAAKTSTAKTATRKPAAKTATAKPAAKKPAAKKPAAKKPAAPAAEATPSTKATEE